mmetsp:Transcript_9790/g.20707  ORF Transcript_9790/g.20707 Transcript_9790/m.20707 type:complete len:237 (-) Transcript_9790:76-786(-)|eukprot:CAMPEP_0183312816 /NCGR_PEP_ID=MMETSP0160_2-20130417/43137_1 /TAXON_ID=2839 ORGANISM="Odontella Sinensis, Strain Grunow 1884" /NCGR_SAMPLE_ID=MMETSP0160_2 /ASSEMBLY_ACC=CAM_ASM_000250 /LENGTH=236 /DNA_ID=CAMNT_0025477749 /DNA_START=48 /DNA_END=758 /DNA_ORIENTATION=-
MTRSSTKSLLLLGLLTSATGFNGPSAKNTAVPSRVEKESSLNVGSVVDPVETKDAPLSAVTDKVRMLANPVSDSVLQDDMVVAKPVAPKRKAPKKGGPAHKEGVFSPVVKLAKTALGDETLNKVRGQVISMHSDVIKDFVATSESSVGKAVLVQLFALADKDGDGKLNKEEIEYAVQKLGFTWLKEKQVSGIMKRADVDESGTIEFDEFVAEAPKTLKTNLVKLAKKNGGDMGLLV